MLYREKLLGKLREGAKLMEKYTDHILEVVADLSGIAGQGYSTLTGDGRMMSWSSDVHWADGNYWLNVIIDDVGRVNILIRSRFVDNKSMYAVIGYCVVNQINYELDES